MTLPHTAASGLSRRDFLRKTLLASSAFTLAACRSGDGITTAAAPPQDLSPLMPVPPAPPASPAPTPAPIPAPTPPSPAPPATPPALKRVSNLPNIGALQAADANGVRLPAGFSSRIVAVQGERPVAAKAFTWHLDPDAGACFAQPDGGWIYVSNSEEGGFNPLVPVQPDGTFGGNGGVGALRFAADGTVVDAYAILENSNNNCAGGLTPWGTWLSCEEIESGWVWECDPTGATAAVLRKALGRFNHEAAGVDPLSNIVYLTEDRGDGCFYRFIPATPNVGGRADLTSGVLEVAVVAGEDVMQTRAVSWLPIPNPQPGYTPRLEDGTFGTGLGIGGFSETELRFQVADATKFAGGEGIWYHAGLMYFTTKGDNRVWCYDLAAATLDVVYDDDWYADRPLTGVDNIVVSDFGDVIVAEDGGNMELVIVTPDRAYPLLQVEHAGSEIAGPAFSPDGTRLYFSSQRGPSAGGMRGVTFEVTGPFFIDVPV